MPIIPTVVEKFERSERSMDIFSRLLHDRIIIIHEQINASLMAAIVPQLLYLDAISHEPIHLYISSPGGDVMSGFGILDVMQSLKSPVHTYALGMVASMAAVLFVHGAQRYVLPNAQIMIHQPLGGASGQASDIEITAMQILKIKKKLNIMLSTCTSQPLEIIESVTDRDKYYDAQEAVEFGLADAVFAPQINEKCAA